MIFIIYSMFLCALEVQHSENVLIRKTYKQKVWVPAETDALLEANRG